MVERVVNHEWHAKNMRQPYVFCANRFRNISQSMRPWHHRGFQHPPNEPGARSHKQHLDANAGFFIAHKLRTHDRQAMKPMSLIHFQFIT